MALKNALVLLCTLPFIAANFAATPIHDLMTGGTPGLSKRASYSINVDPSTLYPTRKISVPVDHFYNESQYEPHSSGKFELRYWFDATYYKQGGPVILLVSGEDNGQNKLPYLQKGILAQLSQATSGVGVVLEHRFYGKSMPTSNLSTESLRFLTTQQALADTAYFAQNVVFAGISDNLKAPNVPWIVYGGSYAGAFAAFLRTRYSNLFFGAIASSAVTQAIWDFWDYYSPVETYGPAECVKTTKMLTNVVDNILVNKADYTNTLKGAFGLQGLTYATDFANVLSDGVGGWQGQNWDPALSSTSFNEYCGNVSSDKVLYTPTSAQIGTVQNLIKVAGYGGQSNLANRMLNYIGWIASTKVTPCSAEGLTADACFSTHNATFYALDDITQTWRSWPYQYCSQWGFLQTGSGVPQGRLPMISRTLDLDFQAKICQDAFNLTGPANVSAINAYGGYRISYPRLAFVDGQADPWIGATVHANAAPARANTTDEPSIIIPGAVHHWDENGIFANETTNSIPPAYVSLTQDTEAFIVLEWLKEWTGPTTTYSRLVSMSGPVGPAVGKPIVLPGNHTHIRHID